MTLVVNLLAGPGSGKSTTAAGIFYHLKQNDVNAELVTEYAKDIVWQGSTNLLGNQVHILGEQYLRMWRLKGQVDVIVTDCPLFLCMYYGSKQSDNFKNLAWELFNEFDNFNYFVQRVKTFNPKGRVQTEEKAKRIDFELESLLLDNEVPFDYVVGNSNAASYISGEVLRELAKASPSV